MRLMGLEALGPKPKTSRPAAQHRIYPYLLRGLATDRPNQVWAADITYIPMARGFLYLVVVMAWHSRYVLAWRLSNTMDTSFCLDALEDALRKGGQRSSTPTKARNSPAQCLPTSWKPLACGSACTAVGAGWTTSLSSDCGAA
jgi:putative transposase